MGNFNMLPLEIMLEILSRVPAESILDFKCVSKPWRNLIQQPSFAKLHLNHLNGLGSSHNSRKLNFISYTNWFDKHYYYKEYDENLNRFTKTTRINLTPPLRYCYILGSCNGLICFNASDGGGQYKPAYICNPITREYVLLPESISEGKLVKFFLTGFGYFYSTNEYKVVRINYCTEALDTGIVQVFTVGSGIGWRYAGKIGDYARSFRQDGVFVNGAIHWTNSQGTIIAFDLASEELHKLPSPPGFSLISKPPPDVILSVLGDILCACFRYTQGWDIWILKKNKNNEDVIWTKEFGHIKNVIPITLTKSGGLICWDKDTGNFCLYTPEDSTSRMLENVDEKFRYSVLHENSLVSLKALGEKDTRVMDSISRKRKRSSMEETESSNH